MRVVVAACTCLFLVQLAVSQKSDSCNIRIEKSDCIGFLNVSLTIKRMKSHNYRILIYSHHYKSLNQRTKLDPQNRRTAAQRKIDASLSDTHINKTEKICVLEKIMEFYKNINSKVYTKKVPKEKISALEDHLIKFTDTCLNCTRCKEMNNIKTLMKCNKYRTRMILNQTQIMHCQEWLLRKANKKWKNNPKQVQEKTIYELDTLQKFVTEAN